MLSSLPVKGRFRFAYDVESHEPLISFNDVMKYVSGRSSTKRRKEYMASQKHTISTATLTHVYVDGVTEELKRTVINSPVIHTWSEVQDVVRWLLHHSHKSQRVIQEMTSDFHISMEEHKSSFYSQPQEDYMDQLSMIFPGLLREFRVGEYRMDGYWPQWQLAIECDEHNHAQYSTDKEVEREKFLIMILHCHVIRFDPYQESLWDVIRRITEHLLKVEVEKQVKQILYHKMYKVEESVSVPSTPETIIVNPPPSPSPEEEEDDNSSSASSVLS